MATPCWPVDETDVNRHPDPKARALSSGASPVSLRRGTFISDYYPGASSFDSPGFSSRVAELSRRLDTVGITVFAPAASGGLVVRSFAPLAGVVEDPVCGSGNAAVAAHLAATGRLAQVGSEWIASQGREVGRDGSVLVRVADAGRTIEIGGQAVTVVDGSLAI